MGMTSMTSAQFDFAPLLPAGLPAPAAKWAGLAKYNFIGGNNDPDQVPVDGLIEAVNAVLKREGKTLATYGLASGPQGYRRLREFLTTKLKRDAGINCVADDILIVSGSLQALDLVNATLLARGDTVIIERDTYQGALNRLTRLGVNLVGIPLHHAGGAPHRTVETRRTIWGADLRGRLLCRPDLGRATPAGAVFHEHKCRRHPHRLILEIDRAGVAGRLHRRTLGHAVADAGAEDRRRLRRAGADGARRILRPAFCQPRPEADARPARQARHADGGAQ